MSDDNLYAAPRARLVDGGAGRFTSPVLQQPGAVAAFGRAWTLALEHIGAIVPVVLLVALPVHALKSLVYAALPDTTPDAVFRALDIVDGFADAAIIPAVIYVVVEGVRTGTSPGPGEALRWGGKAWVGVFFSRLVAGIATGLATCALLIPGLYVAIRLTLVDPIASLSGSTTDVLGRSWREVEGRWWTTCGAVVLMGAVVYAPLVLVALAYGVAAAAVQEGMLSAGGDSFWAVGDVALVFFIGLLSSLAKPLLALLGLVLHLSYRHGWDEEGAWLEEPAWLGD